MVPNEKNKTPIVMDMFQEVKVICEKVNVNLTLLVQVTRENMSSIVIAYCATSLEAIGKAFDEMGRQYQLIIKVSTGHPKEGLLKFFLKMRAKTRSY